MKPTFKNTENFRTIDYNNELFTQYINPTLKNFHDANVMELKFSPTIEEFKLLEEMQEGFKIENNQQHLKFLWPEDVGLFPELLSYLDEQNYKIGMQNLYSIQPKSFKTKSVHDKLVIKSFTGELVEDFLTLNAEEDLKHGVDFQEFRKSLYVYQTTFDHVCFIVGYIDEQPVGSLVLIESTNYFQIDNVLTTENYRGQGIATSLLHHVMKITTNKNKPVLIVADAEDSPRMLYENLGFQFEHSQISVEKSG